MKHVFVSPVFSKSLEQWDNLEFKDVHRLVKIPGEKLSAKDKKKTKRKTSSVDDSEITPDYIAGKPFLLIRDPEVLTLLEERGLDFYSQFYPQADAAAAKFQNLVEFYKQNDNYRILC